MSASGLTSDTDVAVPERQSRRRSVPRSVRLPPPAIAAAVYLLAFPLARRLAPLRTSVLVPLIIVLTLATTWMGVYLLAVAGQAS